MLMRLPTPQIPGKTLKSVSLQTHLTNRPQFGVQINCLLFKVHDSSIFSVVPSSEEISFNHPLWCIFQSSFIYTLLVFFKYPSWLLFQYCHDSAITVLWGEYLCLAEVWWVKTGVPRVKPL